MSTSVPQFHSLFTKSFVAISFLSILVTFVASTADASVTITLSSLGAGANDTVGGAAFFEFTGTAIPTSAASNATDGGASSRNIIDWTTSGGQMILSFDMEHVRLGLSNTNAETIGFLRFTANEDAPFVLSGNYTVTDLNDGSGRVQQNISLIDQTAAQLLFRNAQQSFNTPNEQFTLGGAGGDQSNLSNGSLTGNLIAGHAYEWQFNYLTHAYPTSDLGASATGNLTLTIGASSAVPEAASLLVWAGLACAVALSKGMRHLLSANAQ